MVAQEQQKPFVIGLDLGGTNSVFGIVDQRGNILTTNSIKTQAYKTAEDFVSAGVEALKPIIAKVGGIDQIKAMGIGAPNGNYYRGTIEFAPNVPWGHDGVIPLADMFSEKLGIPVGLTNDANAAAIGEMQYGVARGMKNFIMITLGTGVGSSMDTWSMAATASLESWATPSFAARTDAPVAADARVAWRLIAPPRVWHAQLASSSPQATNRLCYAK